jgi:hypothetical protein
MSADESTEARSEAGSARFDVRRLMTELANAAWAVMEYGWYPLLLFAATPWFLRQLGREHYGHWMLLGATASLGILLSAGTGAATIKAVSKGIGRAATADVERAVKASLAVASIGGICIASMATPHAWKWRAERCRFSRRPSYSRRGRV